MVMTYEPPELILLSAQREALLRNDHPHAFSGVIVCRSLLIISGPDGHTFHHVFSVST